MAIKCDICSGEIEIVAGGKGKCGCCGLVYRKERLAEMVKANQQISTDTNLEIGSIIKIGKYYQSDATSKQDIEWQILDVVDGKALVVSKYCLEYHMYGYKRDSIVWETSELRKWLNETFINAAFSNEEQSKIIPSTITNNLDSGESSGNETIDKVFVLSIAEVNKYFSTSEHRKAAATTYAKKLSKSSLVKNMDSTWWWLRTPGNECGNAAQVDCSGDVNADGNDVYLGVGAVRPAMWLSLSSNYVKKDTEDRNSDIVELEVANGGLYIGTAFAGKAHGKGKSVYKTGYVYEGEWAFGDFNGFGVLSYPNGDKYKGEFRDGSRHGSGTLTWADGKTFVGEFYENHCWKGCGAIEYTDGFVYEGEISDGKHNGNGKLTYPNGDVYHGEWKNGEQCGNGDMIYADGTIVSTITFGNYYQSDDETKEPLEWIIIEKNSNEVLMICKHCISGEAYDTSYFSNLTWENSSIRTWLNESFYNNAFTEEEKDKIIISNVINKNANGGNDTLDKIFLLSIEEFRNLLPCIRKAKPTQSMCYVEEDNGYAYWWLRTPSPRLGWDGKAYCEAYVDGKGVIRDDAISGTTSYGEWYCYKPEANNKMGIRPVLRIKFDSRSD